MEYGFLPDRSRRSLFQSSHRLFQSSRRLFQRLLYRERSTTLRLIEAGAACLRYGSLLEKSTASLGGEYFISRKVGQVRPLAPNRSDLRPRTAQTSNPKSGQTSNPKTGQTSNPKGSDLRPKNRSDLRPRNRSDLRPRNRSDL
jgi:hypothetical protein